MDLNPAQQRAVEYGNGPLLIVAGAGSGKTRTLTARILKLIERGVPPETIVAITFTNKAAEEMKDRITKNLQEKTYNKNHVISHRSLVGSWPFIGTFHSLGALILRKEAPRLGRTGSYTIFDSDDSISLIKKIMKGRDWKSGRWSPAKLMSAIDKIKNTLLESDEILDRSGAALYEEYEEKLKEMNGFDFGDLIEKTVRLLQRQTAVRERYQDCYRQILVDEYQDVNTAQYEFVRLLAEKHKNLAVVGDDAQAIYGWRHADFKNLLSFEKNWPDAGIVLLEENYRSSGNIIRAASAVIAKNTVQKNKNLWTKNHAGEPIRVIAAGSPEEEAGFIASAIQQPNSRGARLSVEELKNLKTVAERSPSTAILYRTNAQSRALEQALIAENIPYRMYGGVKFYERKEIKDVLAALRLAANEKDALAKERLIKNLPKAIAARLIQELPALGNERPPFEIVSHFLSTTRYFERLGAEYQNSAERIENIRELITFISEFNSLPAFLERAALMQSTDRPNNSQIVHSRLPITTTLMTIHMAKGLEFDRVFIVGATEGLLPHQMSYRTGEELEEERRLMYVAMTRARFSLTLSFVGIPSRFLYEIPPELTLFTNLKGNSKELPDEDEQNIVYLE